MWCLRKKILFWCEERNRLRGDTPQTLKKRKIKHAIVAESHDHLTDQEDDNLNCRLAHLRLVHL